MPLQRTFSDFAAVESPTRYNWTVPAAPSCDLDGTDMLYEYDSAFLDDSPLEYVGESINLPCFGSDLSFEPIGNFNAEDFQ